MDWKPAEPRKVIELTDEEAKALDQIMTCKSACKKLVEEVVKHFENAELQERAWWDAITMKYEIDSLKDEGTVLGRQLKIFSIADKQMDRMINDLDRRKKWGDYFKTVFNRKPEGEDIPNALKK
jgi:hypothetical protein